MIGAGAVCQRQPYQKTSCTQAGLPLQLQYCRCMFAAAAQTRPVYGWGNRSGVSGCSPSSSTIVLTAGSPFRRQRPWSRG